jgi:Tol biopolymer transport system component
MGEVFKAHDPRLGRDVALKVSYEAFNDRFTREARSIAALNHTNICHLYDVGPDYLVIEFVEGATLHGPMSFDEALPIINQLIDGIEAAHERNIIHRDLKPANIKITPEGIVKILDFGLAKALAPDGASATTDVMNSPTVAPGLTATAQGTILGTAAYMAPEQARGKQADRRADIWAFGVIVYELLTGKRLFDGETPVEILGQVLHKTPDLSLAPSRARALLAWCLEPDRKDRLQAIGDARRLLRDAAAESAHVPPPVTLARTWLSRAGWVVAAIALVALATVTWLAARTPRVEQPFMHVSIPLPGDAPPSFLALSPDGRMLVMLQAGSELVVRSLDSNVVRPLAGTRLGRTPFWSPDSSTIAFFADNALKTVSASGGPTQILCNETGYGIGGTWSTLGVILFVTESGVWKRVPAGGGSCTDVTKPESQTVRTGFPMFLPDGVHFLYVKATDVDESSGVFVGTLDDPAGHRLLADGSSVEFVPDTPGSSVGHLLFAREGNLVAQSFDATSLQLSGQPFVVAERVDFTSTRPQIAASASAVGTIAILVNGYPERELRWYDRSGKDTGRVAVTGSLGGGVSLAPDGRSVAFVRGGSETATGSRLLDLERNQDSRLLASNSIVVWSPDSHRIAFGDVVDGMPGLYVRGAAGGLPELLVGGGDNRLTPSDWPRDGRHIIYTELNPTTRGDLWLLPVSPPRAPVPLARTDANESQGAISPDGKWLAYSSVESSVSGVFLRSLSKDMRVSDAVLTVSATNALEPRWRADGKELFYLERVAGSRRHKLMAVAINERADNPLGPPQSLFEFTVLSNVIEGNFFLYSPSADGQRFLVNAYPPDSQSSLDLLVNWPASLAR